MASYSLLSSESTVQVLSANVVNPVVYCTIQTSPSSVIASKPVSATAFADNQAVSALTNYADAIETLMQNTHVVAAGGEQTLDASNLLADNVTFTVQYVPAGSAPTSITAEAVVPTALLDFSDAEIGRTLETQAQAIIDGVYANLQSAAGG